MDETKPPGVRIDHIFLNRAVFEHAVEAQKLPPNTPITDLPLVLELQLGISADEKQGQIIFRVATDESEGALYRFEVEMICLCRNDVPDPNIPIREYITKYAPTALFPFVREAVANLTGRGRFGPIWLRPFNVNQVAFGDLAPIDQQPNEGNG